MFCRVSEDHLSGPGSLGERLRALPAHAPPPDGWSRLSRRLDARRGRSAIVGGSLALAASLLVAVGLVGLRPEPAPGVMAPVRSATPAAAPQLAQLISRSQRLEHELAAARPQAVVWSSGRETRAAMIEQRLRRIDAQLNFADASSAERLWRDRVRLMNALVELHRSEAPALHYASYQY